MMTIDPRGGARYAGPMPVDLPNSDESYLRLHAAGWSIGDTAYLERCELVWLVTGTNGENVIRAEEPTRAVGMIGP